MRGRPNTCCFTGHRPEKLPWGSDEADPRCRVLKQKVTDAVDAAYEEGMRHFICGMARGCDLYFAEAVLALRDRHGDVTLEAAVPCLTQAASWPPEERLRWRRILAVCDMETLIQESYSPGCMIRRNRYMVDHSALVIAVYDGTSGGTRRTLEYAIRQKGTFCGHQPGGRGLTGPLCFADNATVYYYTATAAHFQREPGGGTARGGPPAGVYFPSGCETVRCACWILLRAVSGQVSFL